MQQKLISQHVNYLSDQRIPIRLKQWGVNETTTFCCLQMGVIEQTMGLYLLWCRIITTKRMISIGFNGLCRKVDPLGEVRQEYRCWLKGIE